MKKENTYHTLSHMYSGISLKFLIVGEINSMVGYHLMTKGQSIQLGVWRGGGALWAPQQVQSSALGEG